MERESGLVRYDRPASRPQAPPDQVVMKLRDPLRKAEQPSVDSEPVARGNVVSLGLVRVSEGLCLCRAEVPTLLGSQMKKSSTEVSSIDRHESILYQN